MVVQFGSSNHEVNAPWAGSRYFTLYCHHVDTEKSTPMSDIFCKTIEQKKSLFHLVGSVYFSHFKYIDCHQSSNT